MTVEEILKEIRAGLTGEYSIDIVYLENQVKKYSGSANAQAIENGIVDIVYEILPEDKKTEINKMMYMDGKRLDTVFAEAMKLINEHKIEESFKLTEALYTKILINYRETESKAYLSMRNPLEHQLYLYLYSPSKTLERPPFDLSRMVMLHGYNLLELGKPEDAINVLEDAIRYNPVNTDPYFEMCECYKVLKRPEDLLAATKEIISISTTPMELSRCYCNLGYYCVEIKDYDSAVCFYYESLIYDNHPGVTGELHHIHTITQKKITPPTRKEVNAAFEKYGMTAGADKDVLSVTSALAKEAIENKNLGDARFYLATLYGLTNDNEVKAMLDKLPKPAKKQ